MKEIRVLHLDTELGWRGGQQQAYYLHKGLCDMGVHSDFACRKASELQNRLQEEQLPYQSFRYWGEADILAGSSLAAYARKQEINLLHLHSGHALSWGLSAKFFYPSLKLVAARRVDFPIQKNKLSQAKYHSPKLDALVAISENIRKVLLTDGIAPDKISLIHSGVDIHRFEQDEPAVDFRQKFGIPADAILVGTVAAFVAHKDYPNLITAAAIAKAANPKLCFMALGDGVKLSEMKMLARDLGIADSFLFMGYQERIGSFLKAFDIFVLASKKEGLGTSVLDAMSVGLPVIGTKAGGIAEMIEDKLSGLLVEKRNPESLAEAILGLADSPDARVQMGENAIMRVRDFSKEHMISANLELYRTLL
jgi:glycosyltransferase involved in cell wall biosynthesis